jgi:hypothetical protein
VDERALEQTKRRYTKRLWKTVDANPNLTHAEKRRVMFTGYPSAAAQREACIQWRRAEQESQRRAREQQRRADLERLLLGRARRLGFQLIHADDGLKWERVRPQDFARQRGASRERRPQTRRRVARTAGARGDPHPGEPDPDPLSSWRGVVAASVRMHAHLCRRTAAARAA